MAKKVDVLTDAELAKLENQIAKVYKDASVGLDTKWDKYINGYDENIAGKNVHHKSLQERYDEQYQAYKRGEYTKKQFNAWYASQVGRGERWEALRDEMAQRATDANQVAAAYVNDKTPGIYALNANWSAYELQKGTGIAFNLVNEQTIKELAKGANFSEFRVLSVNPIRDYNWNKDRIQEALMSGILQGESIGAISERFYQVMGANKSAAIRNARTAVTSAQNGGRKKTYDSAEAMGIAIEKEWLATGDSRTRDSHRDLDGTRVPNGEAFPNGCEFPGDPAGDPCEVYNCRCTMVAILPKYNSARGVNRRVRGADGNWEEVKGVTLRDKENSISYADWLNGVKWDDDPIRQATDELYPLLARQVEADMLLKKVKNKAYDGIWKDTVHLTDWESKQKSIPLKEQYYLDEIAKAQAAGNTAKVAELQKHLDDLHEFNKKGQAYNDLAKAKAAIDKKVLAKQKEIMKLGGYDPMADAFSAERKNAAMWAKNTKDADAMLRTVSGTVWRTATAAERQAIYDYTWTYSPYNEPLRGIQYGLGGTKQGFKGVGKVSLNAGGRGEAINKMTQIIDKSEYDFDMWLQRGCHFGGMDKFLNIDENLLRYGTEKELQDALLGTSVTEYGFMSCGVAKGKGFGGDIILNVYAPKGTKMMYAEPFSRYGNGDGFNWDGLSKQYSFGSESEIILQQGTIFNIAKVTRTGKGTIYIDLEVIGREAPQVWVP